MIEQKIPTSQKHKQQRTYCKDDNCEIQKSKGNDINQFKNIQNSESYQQEDITMLLCYCDSKQW